MCLCQGCGIRYHTLRDLGRVLPTCSLDKRQRALNPSYGPCSNLQTSSSISEPWSKSHWSHPCRREPFRKSGFQRGNSRTMLEQKKKKKRNHKFGCTGEDFVCITLPPSWQSENFSVCDFCCNKNKEQVSEPWVSQLWGALSKSSLQSF